MGVFLFFLFIKIDFFSSHLLLTPIACFMKFDSDQQRLLFAIDIFNLFKDFVKEIIIFNQMYFFPINYSIINPPL